MVQPSRLKRHIHPLLPLIFFLLIGLVFVILFNKSINEKLFNTYQGYKSQRSDYIDQYNQIKTQQDASLTSPYSRIGDYRLNLTKSLDLNNQIENLLSTIYEFDLKGAKKYKNIEVNIQEDELKIKEYNELSKIITQKIRAIDMYNNIHNFDDCIKSAKKNSDIVVCKQMFEMITTPAVIQNSYKTQALTLLNTYFDMNKLERSRLINKLVPYQNKMINELEVIINSPITLKDLSL